MEWWTVVELTSLVIFGGFVKGPHNNVAARVASCMQKGSYDTYDS